MRNTTTQRIIPDTTKFPDGISGVASQVHDLGLKIGIYSSEFFPPKYKFPTKHWLGAGETTCAGYPASLGYEQVDAAAFAEWGIDCMFIPLCSEGIV